MVGKETINPSSSVENLPSHFCGSTLLNEIVLMLHLWPLPGMGSTLGASEDRNGTITVLNGFFGNIFPDNFL